MISIPIDAARCDLGESDWQQLHNLLERRDTVWDKVAGIELRVSRYIPKGLMIWYNGQGEIVGIWKLEEEQ